MRWPTSPPVHDSAVATVRPRAEARAPSRPRARPARRAGRRHGYGRCVLTGGAGGAKSQVSGTPDLPSAPSDVPLSVKYVAPDEPVRTSTLAAREGQGLAGGRRLAGRTDPRTSLPSTQTLIQAGPPLTVTTRLTPLYGTVTFRVRDVVLPSVARRGDGDRPPAGGQLERPCLYVPSSPTAARTTMGVAGGAGVAPPLPAAGPGRPEICGADHDRRRVRRLARHRDRPVLERRALGRLVHRERRRLDLEERHRDEQVDGLLGLLARVGVHGRDVELVAAAAQVHLVRPGAVGRGGDLVRLLLAGGQDRHRGARQGDALERVLGGRFIDVDDRRRRLRHRDRRRLREAQELDAEVDAEGDDDDGQERRDDEPGEKVRPCGAS